MSSGILDSSLLIDCLRGRAEAVAVLASVTSPATHLLVAAELFAGARDKVEQAQIESFLAGFILRIPTEADGLAALELYKRHHLSHGVDWPDWRPYEPIEATTRLIEQIRGQAIFYRQTLQERRLPLFLNDLSTGFDNTLYSAAGLTNRLWEIEDLAALMD